MPPFTPTTSTTTTTTSGKLTQKSDGSTMMATMKTTTISKTTTTKASFNPTISITDYPSDYYSSNYYSNSSSNYYSSNSYSKNVQQTQNQYLKIGMTILAILLFISLGLLKAFKERYNTLTKCKFLS